MTATRAGKSTDRQVAPRRETASGWVQCPAVSRVISIAMSVRQQGGADRQPRARAEKQRCATALKAAGRHCLVECVRNRRGDLIAALGKHIHDLRRGEAELLSQMSGWTRTRST